MTAESSIYEMSKPGSAPNRLPLPEMTIEGIPASFRRSSLRLPDIAERDLVRHYERLSRMDTCPDFAPQFTGSCTMKYNIRVNEAIADLEGFCDLHPYQPIETLQGALAVLWQMQQNLIALTGLPGASLQPATGAQGELAGLLMVKAYQRDVGQGQRNSIIVTESAHGSNPATGSMCGYRVQGLKSRRDGCIDLDHLKSLLSDHVAALMLTNPNTAGVYESEIETISELVHAAGAFLYLDGANMNALAGIVRPADVGVDIMQVNLHKTFGTPHGGSGPGSGPLLCSSVLEPYLPLPIVGQMQDQAETQFYLVTERPHSVGRVRSFLGNWSTIVRAYAYMSLLGAQGIVQATEQAVLNANYLKHLAEELVEIPMPGVCAHEFVISSATLSSHGVTIEDIAKRLMDYDFHPPLYNFPKGFNQSMLVEPTESEGLREMQRFIDALAAIWKEAESNPEVVRTAPHRTPVGRMFDTLG